MVKLGILEKILPPDNKVFFDCFIEAANICKKSAILYNEALIHGIDEELLLQMKFQKHKGKDKEREVITMLNNTFITPIDREDIQLLTISIRKINKKICKAFMNYNLYKITKPTEEMFQQGKVIIKATTELVHCVSLLKKLHKIQTITDSRNTMKEIETLGDDVLYRATEELFSGKFDPITVIKYRDIYKDLEDALDKCTSVADMVLNIAAKNS